MMELRTFVAVPLPPAVQASVLAAAQALAGALPSVRWSRKVENLHVTIKFLGNLGEERVQALSAALEDALAALPRFQLAVRGLGAFPSARKATVLWAGVDDKNGRLAALAEAVETVAARLALGERERRPFRGHVTVGRAKEGVDARGALSGFAERPFGVAPVDEIHIYESQLGGGPDNQGSTYVLRSRARLGGGTASN
jgi:2'-5' RNA ligase